MTCTAWDTAATTIVEDKPPETLARRLRAHLQALAAGRRGAWRESRREHTALNRRSSWGIAEVVGCQPRFGVTHGQARPGLCPEPTRGRAPGPRIIEVKWFPKAVGLSWVLRCGFAPQRQRPIGTKIRKARALPSWREAAPRDPQRVRDPLITLPLVAVPAAIRRSRVSI